LINEGVIKGEKKKIVFKKKKNPEPEAAAPAPKTEVKAEPVAAPEEVKTEEAPKTE
jgi:hypothetical protein